MEDNGSDLARLVFARHHYGPPLTQLIINEEYISLSRCSWDAGRDRKNKFNVSCVQLN